MSATHTILDSPLGELTVVAEDGALTGLYFAEHARRPDPALFGPRDDRDSLLAETARQVREYFAGDRIRFDLPLHAKGGTFKLKVWAQLARIPYGETRSYGQLAEELGGRNLARAVGAANGQNPLCVIVPCHRVVGAGGDLVGYAGGLDRKRFLLGLEEPAGALEARLF